MCIRDRHGVHYANGRGATGNYHAADGGDCGLRGNGSRAVEEIGGDVYKRQFYHCGMNKEKANVIGELAFVALL